MSATGEQTTTATLQRLAGQRLVVGFDGTTPSTTLCDVVSRTRPGGVILFARNVVDPTQVSDLNRELLALWPKDLPPIRMVDQEGGRVARIRAPATVWPPMRTVGQRQGATPALAKALALELLAMGFDLDLAPVADVDSEPQNPVIGDRSFADNAGDVSQHVTTFTTAMQATGLLACAKHFPGHGDTTLDSHLDLPIVSISREQLEARELVPFKAAVKAGVAAIMSAHIVFCALDPQLPATLSPIVLPRLLRQKLNFDGLVLSDDLEMKAIDGRFSSAEIARLTTLAGIDLLLVCHDADKQMALFEALIHAMESDPKLARAYVQSEHRLIQARRKLARVHRPGLEVVGCATHQALSASIAPPA